MTNREYLRNCKANVRFWLAVVIFIVVVAVFGGGLGVGIIAAAAGLAGMGLAKARQDLSDAEVRDRFNRQQLGE